MSLLTYLSILRAVLVAKLQTFAAMEPVRLRAALTSLVLAGAFLVPALANQDVASAIAGVGAVLLPVLVGEDARRKVSPTV
ncbi:hypothetical protein [Streptomyces sp. NBC_00076]|uniref:hypothetical protein n=1 Tax=Streptomyces sp. NBC_00076 TaxID=2975642 RepID=UPI0032549E36